MQPHRPHRAVHRDNAIVFAIVMAAMLTFCVATLPEQIALLGSFS